MTLSTCQFSNQIWNSDSSDQDFFTVRDLEDHLMQHHHMHPSFAAVLIVPPDKSMDICFNQTSICLFESHTHGPGGHYCDQFLSKCQPLCQISRKNGYARLEEWITRFKHNRFKAEINFEKGFIGH